MFQGLLIFNHFFHIFKWEDLCEQKKSLYINNKCMKGLNKTLVRKNNANKTT